MPIVRILLLCALGLASTSAAADEVRVAVAANFAPVLRDLAKDFRALSGHELVISTASTGRHYAQIRNGAAFDLFLGADVERPAHLEREGFGVPGSRFVYAQGRLVLWVPLAERITDPRAILADPGIERIAIANPRLAPYGLAARQVLERWGLWTSLQGRLVRGESIGQAYQFVASGNAQAGLVALSQLRADDQPPRGARIVIPAGLHRPIRQQALLLRATPAARALVAFLRSDRARDVIRAAGYTLPGDA